MLRRRERLRHRFWFLISGDGAALFKLSTESGITLGDLQAINRPLVGERRGAF
jgi:glycerate-2-kinase